MCRSVAYNSLIVFLINNNQGLFQDTWIFDSNIKGEVTFAFTSTFGGVEVISCEKASNFRLRSEILLPELNIVSPLSMPGSSLIGTVSFCVVSAPDISRMADILPPLRVDEPCSWSEVMFVGRLHTRYPEIRGFCKMTVRKALSFPITVTPLTCRCKAFAQVS